MCVKNKNSKGWKDAVHHCLRSQTPSLPSDFGLLINGFTSCMAEHNFTHITIDYRLYYESVEMSSYVTARVVFNKRAPVIRGAPIPVIATHRFGPFNLLTCESLMEREGPLP